MTRREDGRNEMHIDIRSSDTSFEIAYEQATRSFERE